MLEGLILSNLRNKKHVAVNAISDTFVWQWNFVLYGAKKKLVQFLLQESERIVNKTETQIEREISNDYTKPEA